jgi:tape measure domain-containing protein
MATELGVAYLSLAASTGQFGKDVKRTFGDFEATAEKSSRRSGSLIGSALSKGLGFGVKAIASMGVAIVGLAATGGINRAIAIEGAQKKLEGLGHSAKSITAIMGSALASVKGTAFGLGDAATVAATLTAAGVKEGRGLESVLKTVADTAAISGRSLTDIGLIYSSVAARGKLQGDDMLQLMSSGIPVLQLLAKQLHTTSADVSDMVRSGEIDFKTFAAAMQSGMGGAALKSGETFKGALANVYAALGRLGAVVATPALASLKTLFNAAIPALDALTAKLKPVMDQLGPKMSTALSSGLGSISKLAGSLQGTLAPILGTVRTYLTGLTANVDFGSLITSGSQIISTFSPLGLLFKSLQPLLPQVASAFSTLAQQGIGLLVPLVTQLGPLFAQVSSGLVSAGTQIGSALLPVILQLAQSAMPVLVDVINAVVPVFSQLTAALLPVVDVVAQLVTALLPPFASAITALLPAISPLVSAVLGIVTALLPVVDIVVQLVQQLLPPLMAVINALLPPIVNLATTLAGALAPIIAAIGRIITALMPILSLLVSILGAIVGAVAPVVAIIAGGLVNALSAVIGWLGGVITAIADFMANGIGAITSLPSAIGGIGDQISGFFSGLWSNILAVSQAIWNGIVAFFQGLMKNLLFIIIGPLGTLVLFIIANWDRIVAGTQAIWNSVVAFIASIPARIVAGLVALASIPGRVAAWFGGVVSAIQARFNAAVAFVGSVPGRVLSGLATLATVPARVAAWFAGVVTAASSKFGEVVTFIKGVPGKITAALGSLGSLLVNAGRSLVNGFLRGIKSAWDGLVSWVKAGMSNLRGLWPFSPAKWGPFSGHGYVTYSGKALGEDFAASLMAQRSRVQNAASSLMGAAQISAPTPTVTSSDSGTSGPLVAVTTYNPQAEPTSVTVNRALQTLAQVGRW